MKKITTLLFLCMISVLAFAGPVSRNQASEIAKRYLQKNRVSRGVNPSSEVTLAYECMPKKARSMGISSPLYYVFNQGKQDGFVIVAGDDRMTPVVGYVDEGSFVLNEVNDNLRWWLSALEETMVSVTKSKSKSQVFTTMEEKAFPPYVSPLVQVNWGQGAPYNNMCPNDAEHGGRSLAGCSAIGIAQVLSKWQSPEHGSGIVNYTTYAHRKHIVENLNTFVFDWDNMLPRYFSGQATEAQNNAVAKLVYACGIAIEMDYCAYASGAFVYSNQLEKHFNIDPACNEVNRCYYTRNEWDNMIKKELSEGRPVIYSGFSMDAGHTFVCDGYNKDGLFHINWGWDGSCNGFFALAELNSAVEVGGAPSNADGNFNLDQSAVFGVQPKVGEGNQPEYQVCFTSLKPSGRVSRSNVSLSLSGLCTDGNGFEGVVALGVYDKEGKLASIISKDKKLKLSPRQSYSTYSLRGSLPETLADGVYNLVPMYKVDEGDYQPMRGRKGSPYVGSQVMKLEGENLTLENPEMSESKISVVSINVPDGQLYAGASNTLEIVLRNDGAMYNGPVVLSREDGDKDVRVFHNGCIIETGEQITLRGKVLAPSGVDKDVLKVWVAKSDNDFYYNNGFEYSQITSCELPLVKTTAGKPKLSIDRLLIKNKTAYVGEPLRVEMTVSNTGGFFGNDLYAFTFPVEGGSGLTSGVVNVFLDKGEKKTVNFEVPISGLADGSYMIQVFRVDETNNYVGVGTNSYNFTIRSKGNFTLNSDNYGVFAVDYAWKVPEGVKCGVVTDVDGTQLHIDYRYLAGDVVPAKTPVVVYSEKSKNVGYQAVESTLYAPEDNLLSTAVDEQGYTYAGEGDFLYYGCTHDGSHEHYGMFWMKDNGAPFKLASRKCYLAVPANVGKPDGYPFIAAATGIEDLLILSEDAPIYTLSGLRVHRKLNELPKGLYIVGGKKVYVK